ncbi:serine/threonine-protein phosphatase 6 regulatory subunit 3 isoform X1 [Histomonas meleagridis]|uniref:serine/threonine-protein phosphatase 6 regulatory subunit 3 isoform X1 n=1 Tax=Histomonas meleagridis TaxID=135588 RepID=UPI00355AA835|nr:serine/threonine-protein phosphatase 6 regulatory subunit 3 isoform X1 [Histomonas meleagridis]KAH0797980.1 serine/threonine-protein phosphatase 6 regulatory subunit 3 isoform X1 [Histomonas meleagridis]
MFFWNLSPALNTISELLKKDDVTLTEILDDSSLPTALRNSLQELMEYVQRPQIIDELFEWALTKKFKDYPKGQKYSRSSVSIFTNCSPTMQQNFLQNEKFIEKLKEYTTSNQTDLEPFIVGNFQRIIETYTRLTNGTFLEKFPEIFDFLMRNISYLGVFELFIYLVTESPFRNTISEESWKQYVELSNSSSGYYIIFSIHQAIDKCDDLKPIFQTDEILEILLKTATTTTNKLLAAETFNLIYALFSQNLDNPKIHEYASSYNYQNDCSLSCAIHVFRDLKPEVINFIFTFPISTFVIEAVESAFQSKTVEEQSNIIKENDLLHKLVENSLKHRSEGRLADFAETISKIEGIPTSEEWEAFCKNELQDYITKRDSSYGGSLPTGIDNLYDDDEDEDLEESMDGSDSDDILDSKIDIPSFSSSDSDSLDHDYSDDAIDNEFAPVPPLELPKKEEELSDLPPPLSSPNTISTDDTQAESPTKKIDDEDIIDTI